MHGLREEEEKKKTAQTPFTDAPGYSSFFSLNAYYSQNLRARREPGQNINVDTGDGAAHPLAALAHGRAGIDSLRRSGAGTQAEERQQRARYHLHCWIGWPRR